MTKLGSIILSWCDFVDIDDFCAFKRRKFVEGDYLYFFTHKLQVRPLGLQSRLTYSHKLGRLPRELPSHRRLERLGNTNNTTPSDPSGRIHQQPCNGGTYLLPDLSHLSWTALLPPTLCLSVCAALRHRQRALKKEWSVSNSSRWPFSL